MPTFNEIFKIFITSFKWCDIPNSEGLEIDQVLKFDLVKSIKFYENKKEAISGDEKEEGI